MKSTKKLNKITCKKISPSYLRHISYLNNTEAKILAHGLHSTTSELWLTTYTGTRNNFLNMQTTRVSTQYLLSNVKPDPIAFYYSPRKDKCAWYINDSSYFNLQYEWREVSQNNFALYNVNNGRNILYELADRYDLSPSLYQAKSSTVYYVPSSLTVQLYDEEKTLTYEKRLLKESVIANSSMFIKSNSFDYMYDVLHQLDVAIDELNANKALREQQRREQQRIAEENARINIIMEQYFNIHYPEAA